MPAYPNRISLFFAVLATALLAQEAPVAMKQPSAGQVMAERDREKEEQVAKLFEGIRTDAKIPSLKRIGHRDDLEQGLCTGALTGKHPNGASAFYTTDTPESITPELKKIASSNRLNRLDPKRYAVAVWRVRDPQIGKVTYWVGVGLYGSALGEFVDCHFTDDVHYCGKWKGSVARPCRGK